MTDRIPQNERELEELLSEPSEATRKVVASWKGDVLVLGGGGKMGPTLAMMLQRASKGSTVHAVSRFSDKAVKARLDAAGVNTMEADLLDETRYEQLPPAEQVYFMAGMKFGTTGDQPLTWALNTFLPGLVGRHFRNARIVVFSTGNVYPFMDIAGRGAREETIPDPIGEYAQSCLGRERMFHYFSRANGTPVTLVRLNYANEPRYGIIVDLARKIMDAEPIDLTMGTVNLIWQRDANDYIIRAVTLAESPPFVLNVAGPDVVGIRPLAEKIGKALGKEPVFASSEAPTALLSDASLCFEKFGPPKTSLDEAISLIVSWVASGKPMLGKPTKYDVRNGKF